MTMVRVGEKLAELCRKEGLTISVKYVDLWVSDYFLPTTDLVVEMFPYYKNLSIPVVDGKPFLNPLLEDGLYVSLIETIKELLSKKI